MSRCLLLAIGLCCLTPCSAAMDERLVGDRVYLGTVLLVDVGPGRKLNLYCTGNGSPVVVLEAGLGDSSKSWGLVQPEISKHTRTCSYDRAGLGFSDPARVAGTSANATADLWRLLQTAKEPPPYVLVGHSYGGMISKLFAFTYPRTFGPRIG